MTRYFWLGFVLLSLLLALATGCGNEEIHNGETIKREGESDITYVEENDPKMAAAIDKARGSVDQFITALNNPKPSQSFFSVKMLIEDGEHQEHMWTESVKFKNGEFHGTLNNTPYQLKSVKLGDQVHVPKNNISDWMYVENKKLVGGYTLRALRDTLPEQERKEFDSNLPFTIE